MLPEQSYRELVRRLKIHPLVKTLKYDYKWIKILWVTGIKEIWFFDRYKWRHKRYLYYRSKKYFPVRVPEVNWWDELSNGFKMKSHLNYDINDIEYNVNEYISQKYWTWKDFKKCGFFENKLFVHQLMNYIMTYKWQDINYPDSVLVNSLNNMMHENTDKYCRNKVYKYSNLVERPGIKLLLQYFPYAILSSLDPNFYFNFRSLYTRKVLYRSIYCLIRKNYKLEKTNVKLCYNFDYLNILKFMDKINENKKLYRFKPIGLIRKIIKDFDLSNKSFLDVDPGMGENFLAAYAENCPYYYKESCPFDVCGTKLASFLKYDILKYDEDKRYDFSIYFDPLFDEKSLDEYFDKYFGKVDMSIIYINHKYIDKYKSLRPPSKFVNIIAQYFTKIKGQFFIYN